MRNGIIVLLVLLAAALGLWYFAPTSDIAPGEAFEAEGNLVRNNPGLKPDTWFLVYERPGEPALTAELDISGLTSASFAVGDRVRVEGTKEGDVVRVRTIEPATPMDSGLTVKLFYYNPTLDQGPGGVQCSKAGLVAVERTIPDTQTPLRDAIRLLLRGELSEEERASGITTEFPLSGFSLADARIEDGVATLTFSDSQNASVGGSCRVGILSHQIEATALQFPTVQGVRFQPEELFQP